ncbi:MAG TPA: sulfatase-like hydrolase/transferase, partial [Vicinamibacterales bacterium]|nr:sulfatase-like hydrolase/transferase [Vicinamibacterales bacterium]
MSRPIRFTFILALMAAATVLAAAGGWRYARASAPVSGPIILISIDTLRADHLPAYGYRQVKTPALDSLAADGVVFERAYAHAPLTLPSHATLLTGRLPFETGVRDEAAALKSGERGLPQMLRDRGYATAGIVSTSLLRADTGIAQGFAAFDDDIAAAPLGRVGVERVRDGGQSETLAEKWLEGPGRSRAFLFLQLNEPHAPYAPPERFARFAPYDAEIAYADEIVGRLIRYLKSHQLYDRSTIILLSDHGEGLGDHGEQEHGLLLHDETIRVPLVIKPEGNAGAGRRVREIVQIVDIAPTVLDLVKAPRASGLRGRSLKPLLEGSGALPPVVVYSEALYAKNRFGWSELTATIDERGLVVRAGAGPDEPLVDPRDKVELVETYRRALARAADRQWPETVALFQEIVRAEPEMADMWTQLAAYASLVGRYDLAVDAYKRVIDLDSSSSGAYLGAAAALARQQKLRDAATQAAIAADLAADPRSSADAHELLARIAASRHDADAAKAEAARAQRADPKRPVSAFITGRLLYDQGRYEAALTPFEAALALQRESHATIADLHYLAGDAYARLDRAQDAEAQLAAEIQDFPENVRARGALAALYRSTDRADAADRAIDEMTRVMPTPESYQIAARLWTQSGNRRQADAVRA